MDTMTAAEAKQKFGKLLDKAQQSPVGITKHGREVGVFMSSEAYAMEERQRERWVSDRIRMSKEQIEAGHGIAADKVYAEMQEFVQSLNKLK